MSAEYRSASETIRRALRHLREEGLVATQSTRGTFVLRQPAQAGRSPEIARLESALQAAEARLARRIDTEIAKLREELEYTQAQVMALERQGEGTVSRDRDVGP